MKTTSHTATIKPSVYIGVPTYNRQLDIGTVEGLLVPGVENPVIAFRSISLLAMCFNHLLTDAYNKQAEFGLTHFCLLHADIGPERGWLGKMLRIMQDHGLGVLSAVSPIKGYNGATSCALDNGSKPVTLSIEEIKTRLPETFTRVDTAREFGSGGLLINTGCMLIDMEKVRPEKCYFEINDRIIKAKHCYEWRNIPEDWNFSRMLMKNNVRYGATMAVKLTHSGNHLWINDTINRG